MQNLKAELGIRNSILGIWIFWVIITTCLRHHQAYAHNALAENLITLSDHLFHSLFKIQTLYNFVAQRTVATNLIVSSSKQKNIRILRCHFYQGSFIAFSSRHWSNTEWGAHPPSVQYFQISSIFFFDSSFKTKNLLYHSF